MVRLETPRCFRSGGLGVVSIGEYQSQRLANQQDEKSAQATQQDDSTRRPKWVRNVVLFLVKVFK